MSMDLENVKSDGESTKQTKVTWTNVTSKGKIAIKRIQSAIANQTSEKLFKKEITEALSPVFDEIYMLVKTNVVGFEEFLDNFSSLRDMKHPKWSNVFEVAAFNAANVPNADIKRQLTDMEVRLKAIDHNLPTTNDFIRVRNYHFLIVIMLYNRNQNNQIHLGYG